MQTSYDGGSMKHRFSFPAVAVCLAAFFAIPAMAQIGGAVNTSAYVNGNWIVNANVFNSGDAVYLSGGPHTMNASGLSPVTDYYFQVTDPSGHFLLSTDDISCRTVHVQLNGGGGGVVYGVPSGAPGCSHPAALTLTPSLPLDPNGGDPVVVEPFAPTPNGGGVYKLWITPVSDFNQGALPTDCTITAGASDGSTQDPAGICKGSFGFVSSNTKTDNFRIKSSTICVSNCGGFTQSTISGVKFYDQGQNNPPTPPDGVMQLTESPIANWTIIISGTLNGQAFTDTLLTDSSGSWVDAADNNSTITVCEVLPSSWTQSPLNTVVTGFSSTPSSAPGNGPNCWTGTVTQDTANLNFGNFIQLTGTKHYDLTGNDTGLGLSGWTINLTCAGGTGTPCPASTTTDVNGNYTVYALAPITSYTVCEGSTTGYSQTYPNAFTTSPAANGAAIKTDCTAPNAYGWAGTIGAASGAALDFGNVAYITGTKYNDLNKNGKPDANEPTIQGFKIDVCFDTNCSSISATTYTDANGVYRFNLPTPTSTYVIQEDLPANQNWVQTGPIPPATDGAASATPSMHWSNSITGGPLAGLYFTNTCIGGGGLTLGFWSNKNGQALMTGSSSGKTLLPGVVTLLGGLNLRNATGALVTPFANYAAFNTWILNATATNMAYMLSAQLATMELNVYFKDVNPNALILYNGNYVTVQSVMTLAIATLGTSPVTVASGPARTLQTNLQVALNNANNNLSGAFAPCSNPVTTPY